MGLKRSESRDRVDRRTQSGKTSIIKREGGSGVKATRRAPYDSAATLLLPKWQRRGPNRARKPRSKLGVPRERPSGSAPCVLSSFLQPVFLRLGAAPIKGLTLHTNSSLHLHSRYFSQAFVGKRYIVGFEVKHQPCLLMI